MEISGLRARLEAIPSPRVFSFAASITTRHRTVVGSNALSFAPEGAGPRRLLNSPVNARVSWLRTPRTSPGGSRKANGEGTSRTRCKASRVAELALIQQIER